MLLCNFLNRGDLLSKLARSASVGMSSLPAAMKLRNTPTRMNGRIKTLWKLDHRRMAKSKEIIESDPRYSEYDIKVEHYIVSTGFTEMIKSVHTPYFTTIFSEVNITYVDELHICIMCFIASSFPHWKWQAPLSPIILTHNSAKSSVAISRFASTMVGIFKSFILLILFMLLFWGSFISSLKFWYKYIEN